MMSSGLITPIAQIPTPDLAVPYAAPKPIRIVDIFYTCFYSYN